MQTSQRPAAMAEPAKQTTTSNKGSSEVQALVAASFFSASCRLLRLPQGGDGWQCTGRCHELMAPRLKLQQPAKAVEAL